MLSGPAVVCGCHVLVAAACVRCFPLPAPSIKVLFTAIKAELPAPHLAAPEERGVGGSEIFSPYFKSALLKQVLGKLSAWMGEGFLTPSFAHSTAACDFFNVFFFFSFFFAQVTVMFLGNPSSI